MPIKIVILLLTFAAPACAEEPRTYSTPGAEATPIFSENFDGDALSDNWRITGKGAQVDSGTLLVEGLHNHPVWLNVELPDDVRIEFDAIAEGEEGDIKVEVAGDGTSFAKTASYTASGYVVIFGGWNNTINAIARRDEHGRDRKTKGKPKVEANRRYHFTLIHQHDTLRWELDGQEVLVFEDPAPLVGAGHRYFAFNNWESRVRFDNLIIYAL
ncbi:MAG TPA: hypothetical protein ENJ18_09350 [Nannocystis exedens]|nr:hypothetical protein [Nannocystis exedens]